MKKFIVGIVLALSIMAGGLIIDASGPELSVVPQAQAKGRVNEDPGGGGVGTQCSNYPSQLGGASLYLAAPPSPFSPAYFKCDANESVGSFKYSTYYESYFFQPGSYIDGWTAINQPGWYMWAWRPCHPSYAPC